MSVYPLLSVLQLEKIKKQTRSDDIATLRKLLYTLCEHVLNDDEKITWLEAKSKYAMKVSRGFNDPFFGRLLCPHRLSAEYAKSPIEYVAGQAGCSTRLSNLLP